MAKNSEKRLVLVNPATGNYFLRLAFTLFFSKNIPISLLTIAGLTPREYKIEFINEGLFLFKKNTFKNAIVGITCLTASAKRAYKLALDFRNAGACVVMGGPHVSALPEEALQYSDSVVIGEAESVWKEVTNDFESGTLKKIYKGQPLEDFFSPVYDYFLNIPPRILQNALIPISRGCKYHCEFCAPPAAVPRNIKIEQVIELIKRVKQHRPLSFLHKLFRPMIFFADDNIFSNPRYSKRLFQEIIPLKINWVSQASIDMAFDEEALSLAKQSGCKSLFIGFESIYPKELKKTSISNITSTKDYIRAIRRIKSYGIKVIGSFIIGFDYYTNLDYLKLLFFLISSVVRARFQWVALTILTPFPGSNLFERLKHEGRITTYDWNKYDLLFHVVFKPKISGLQLLLWFFVIRMISLFCSTTGIMIYISSVLCFVLAGL